ncbi:carotenoid ester lipase precursor [Lentinus tigrinus ALCF2SS1-7]|uniref:Carboxylic ester hydrolase n=1 Tax=Lentinus tigrinus ALCF2SS1-6 TaxID=1328759 RepID=A0A5C2S6C6_9APHY|nr:carotenoid ester lipase precursor [Lentinus tigrinus ALCF2SS1-6]RPD68930.1 carotenoid ester lipase precursor [Lentinus tigrinus ALCF2SS1-7]
MLLSATNLLLLLSSWHLSALISPTATGPRVQLDQASVLGTVNGSVESFLGISYAEPPVGDLRFRLPRLIDAYKGTIKATMYGDQCIQQVGMPNLPPEVLQAIGPYMMRFASDSSVPQNEDCLTLNVIRPANISPDAKLPILFWIYGGVFAVGSTATPLHNGSAIVQRSIDLGQPIIYVAVNYRLNIFGFLGGAEVKEAGVGNLGLQDQRVALRWVSKYISSFGGDPTKVTIWGESAGAISVFSQFFTNGGDSEGLFRAGIMSSGSAVPSGDITEVQGTYDFIVDQVGCKGTPDTLACLRTVSTDSLLAAADKTPPFATGFVDLTTVYAPRADGLFVEETPQRLAHHGQIADVPFIIGDVKDEGPLLSLGNLNITTDDQFVSYISQSWFPGATAADLKKVLELYPSDPAAGSPFDTGDANALTPEFKRLAAMKGDWFFNAPRRRLLERFSSQRTTYNFLSARVNVPPLGYPHGHDLLVAFGPDDMADYFIRFVNNLNPNGDTGLQWPTYDTTARATLQFNDGAEPLKITADDERLVGMSELSSLSLRFPF